MQDMSANNPAGWEWLDDERRMFEEQQAAQDWEVMLLSERPAIADDDLVMIILGMDNHLIDVQNQPSRQKLCRNAEHLKQIAVSPFSKASQEKNFWE